jgi:hypothetical protein
VALTLFSLFNLKIENMKTKKVSLQVEMNDHEEIPKNAWIRRYLKYAVIIIMLSAPPILSSCAVGYETPYDDYGVIVPEYDSFGVVIDPWDYGWRHEHREWINQHHHWRHDYRSYRGIHHERH